MGTVAVGRLSAEADVTLELGQSTWAQALGHRWALRKGVALMLTSYPTVLLCHHEAGPSCVPLAWAGPHTRGCSTVGDSQAVSAGGKHTWALGPAVLLG